MGARWAPLYISLNEERIWSWEFIQSDYIIDGFVFSVEKETTALNTQSNPSSHNIDQSCAVAQILSLLWKKKILVQVSSPEYESKWFVMYIWGSHPSHQLAWCSKMELESMKYAQLQKLAKKHGIKANQKVGSNGKQVFLVVTS